MVTKRECLATHQTFLLIGSANDHFMSSIVAEEQFTEAEYNALKRKVDWVLLPLVRAHIRI